jgi:O-methyltransferase
MNIVKQKSKDIFHLIFKLLGKLPTARFSDFFSNLGYLIKSEAFYNSIPAKLIDHRDNVHELLSSQHINKEMQISFFEFGVYRGQTFAIWVKNNKNPSSVFAGFDTFTGLPEDWGNIRKGSYSAKGALPDIKDSRVTFQIGLIQDKLPSFVSSIQKGVKKIIHIDVDLYNATLFTLITMQPYLEKGDIIIFDDFFTLTKATHEFRALFDFLSLYKLTYLPVMKCEMGQLAIEIQ